MKKIIIAVALVSLLSGLGGWYLCRPRPPQWHARFSYGGIEFRLIARGEQVYVDENDDGIPQAKEQVPDSGNIQLAGAFGKGRRLKLFRVITKLAPEATGPKNPQVIGFFVQSPDHPQVWQSVELVASTSRGLTETFDLNGKLQLELQVPGDRLTSGQTNEIRVSLLSKAAPNSPRSPLLGLSKSKICTSLPTDRTRMPFERSQCPKITVLFSNGSTIKETVIDGLC